MRSHEVRKEFTRAQDVMSPRVVTLCAGESMRRAAAVLLEKGISGAPVLGAQDKPVGVLTKTDIARYERDHVSVRNAGAGQEAMRTLGTLEAIGQDAGFHPESEEDKISEWMTPKVVAVARDAPMAQVIREMLERHIHRIFVRDGASGRICGVITSFDILRFVQTLLDGDFRPRKRREAGPATNKTATRGGSS